MDFLDIVNLPIQAQKTVLAGPVSGAAVPTFRVIENSDIPGGGTKTFVAADRATTTPDVAGQLGYESDTGAYYKAGSTTEGDWQGAVFAHGGGVMVLNLHDGSFNNGSSGLLINNSGTLYNTEGYLNNNGATSPAIVTADYTPAEGDFLAFTESVDPKTNGAGAMVPTAPSALTPAFVGSAITALNASNLGSGTVAPARLGTGSGGATKFLREDSTFQTIAGGGDLLAANNLSDVANTATSRSNLGANNADNLTAGTVAQARLGTGSGGAGTKVLYDDQTYKTPTGSTPTTTRGDLIRRGASADERLAFPATVDEGSSLIAKGSDPVWNTTTTGLIIPWNGGNNEAGVGSTNGTGASINLSNPNTPVIPLSMELVTGTTTTGGAARTLTANGVNNGQRGCLLPSHFTRMILEQRVNIPTLSDGTETFLVYLGFLYGSSNASTLGTIGTAIRISGSTVAVVGRSGSVDTVGANTTTIVAATTLRLRLVWTIGTKAEFYANGTLIGEVTTGLPGDYAVAPQIQVIKSAGTTSRTVYHGTGRFVGIY